jgi:hypothetical protein
MPSVKVGLRRMFSRTLRILFAHAPINDLEAPTPGVVNKAAEERHCLS